MQPEQQQEENVKILSFQTVLTWKTQPPNNNNNKNSSASEVCAICRSDISDYCVECAATSSHGHASSLPHQKIENEKNVSAEVVISCTVAAGKCGHAFHKHCVKGWLKSHTSCPLCQDPWEQVGDLDRSALM